MSRLSLVALTLGAVVVFPALACARLWTDTTGQYSVEAELVAFNDRTVILQRADHELGAIPLDRLSAADREYLQSKEAQENAGKITGALQTWTMRDGTKLIGRLVGYARRDLTLQRRRGRIYVNDRVFENLPELYQLMLPKIVAEFERINQPDRAGLEAWLVRQRGQPRTFTIDGVNMEQENGDEYIIPFFLFSPEDLQLLQPGWEAWLAANQGQNYDQQEDQSFMLQSLAAARQRDREVQRQIAMMQLKLQAVQTGLTSLWEVTLYPGSGTAGVPQWVVVPGRNSADATNQALAQHPGFVAGPVRRLNRF